MSQTTALLLGAIIYILLPIVTAYFGYKAYKKFKQPKMLEYKAIPKLGYIPEKSLPTDIKMLLTDVNDKGEKLRMLYGDTNKDGVIDNKDAVNETYVMVNKLLDEHIPQAMMDYRSLHDLGEQRTKTVAIGYSDVTGKQALLDILNTINGEFDKLLDAIYHEDGQKLLITNRYLQQRFDGSANHPSANNFS